MNFLNKHQTIIFGLLFILGLAAMPVASLYKNDTEETGLLRKVVLEAAAPLQKVFVGTRDGIAGAWRRYIFLVGLQEENRSLRQRIALLESELNRTREIRLECERLQSLLDLKDSVSYPVVSSRVMLRDRASHFRSFVIDRGSRHGIEIGSPVMAAEGVVGKVMDVSWSVSKVLLVNDYNCRIDALIQETRVRGILQGGWGTDCVLKYVPQSESVREGDRVVTSGLAGVFPKGLPLGTVIKVSKSPNELFQDIRVRPMANVDRVEEVLVVVRKKQKIGDDELDREKSRKEEK